MTTPTITPDVRDKGRSAPQDNRPNAGGPVNMNDRCTLYVTRTVAPELAVFDAVIVVVIGQHGTIFRGHVARFLTRQSASWEPVLQIGTIIEFTEQHIIEIDPPE